MASDGMVSPSRQRTCFPTARCSSPAYQGALGWRIRRRRGAGAPQDFGAVKRHRALGPVLAALLPIGYLAGLVTAYVHKGDLLRYPAHLAAGTALLAAVGAAVLVSRRIRGAQSPWRAPHLALGLTALGIFLSKIHPGAEHLPRLLSPGVPPGGSCRRTR